MDEGNLKRRREGKVDWRQDRNKSENEGMSSECIHSIIFIVCLRRIWQ